MREMAIGPYGEDDMLLLYHHLTDTAPTPGQSEWAMWRDKVPLLAFRHPCVLHMLLAVTALRLARGKPGDAERFRQHAERHSSIGMAQATELLPRLSLENCDALYIVAILVQTYTFGKGPRPNDLFLIAEGVQVPWWDLLRGVRFVIGTMGFDAIFSGILGPLKHDGLLNEPSSASLALPRDLIVVIRWEVALRNVSDLISSSLSGPEKDVFVNMLEHLIVAFRGTFGGPDDRKDGLHGRFDVVMAWLYRLDDIFVLRVGENHPVALVMLAHFGLLLHTLEYVWFMAGWGTHVVSQVSEVLGAEYAQWLNWPLETVETLATRRIDHMADEGLET